MGRGGEGRRHPAAGLRTLTATRHRADRLLPPAHGSFQMSAQRGLRRRAAAPRQRQAVQAQAARDVSVEDIPNDFERSALRRLHEDSAQTVHHDARVDGVGRGGARRRRQRRGRVGLHGRDSGGHGHAAFQPQAGRRDRDRQLQGPARRSAGDRHGERQRADDQLQGERAGHGPGDHLYRHGRGRLDQGQGDARRAGRRDVYGQEVG